MPKAVKITAKMINTMISEEAWRIKIEEPLVVINIIRTICVIIEQIEDLGPVIIIKEVTAGTKEVATAEMSINCRFSEKMK
jgi:hypothetical protein